MTSRARTKRPAAAISHLPLHTQIRETLRTRILDCTYAPHSQLPTECELTAAFRVSRITVRQARHDLQKEGLIFKIHVKGAFVSKPKEFQDLARLQGFGEAVHRHGYETFCRLIGLRYLAPDKQATAMLKTTRGEKSVEVKRVRYLNR